MKYELILWLSKIINAIPGRIGCCIRNSLLPYKHGINVRFWEGGHIDSPSKLRIGNNVSINRRCTINAGGGVTIGDNTLIGPGVVIYSQNHRYEKRDLLINSQGYVLKSVTIEDNVWIAANSIILPGVTIGRGSVIGSGSVVTRDVPSYSVVAGSPAKVIRLR